MRTFKPQKSSSTHSRRKSLVPKLILIQSYFRRFLARNCAIAALQKNIVRIQRHTRGFLQRKRFRPMLIDKLLREQEEAYQHRISEVEEALDVSVFSSPGLERVSILDLPLSQHRWFSPSKNRKLLQPVIFDFDIYTLAATEIQRVSRGYFTRKRLLGGFKQLRARVVRVQRLFREWAIKRGTQIEFAVELLKKQTSTLVTTYKSYSHLRSLIQSEDLNGEYSKFLAHYEGRLRDCGIYSSSHEYSKLKSKYNSLKLQRHNEKAQNQHTLSGLMRDQNEIIEQYSKGIKELKFHLELSHKSSVGLLGNMVKELVISKSQLTNNSTD